MKKIQENRSKIWDETLDRKQKELASGVNLNTFLFSLKNLHHEGFRCLDHPNRYYLTPTALEAHFMLDPDHRNMYEHYTNENGVIKLNGIPLEDTINETLKTLRINKTLREIWEETLKEENHENDTA